MKCKDYGNLAGKGAVVGSKCASFFGGSLCEAHHTLSIARWWWVNAFSEAADTILSIKTLTHHYICFVDDQNAGASMDTLVQANKQVAIDANMCGNRFAIKEQTEIDISYARLGCNCCTLCMWLYFTHFFLAAHVLCLMCSYHHYGRRFLRPCQFSIINHYVVQRSSCQPSITVNFLL